MKSILKFTLLAALIVSGKLAKEPAQVATAPVKQIKSTANFNSVILVHQVLTSEPVRPALPTDQMPPSGNGLLTEMY